MDLLLRYKLIATNRKGKTKVLFKRLNSKIGKPAKPIWGKIKAITAKKEAI